MRAIVKEVADYMAFWLTGILASALGGLAAASTLTLLGCNHLLIRDPRIVMLIATLWGSLFVALFHFACFFRFLLTRSDKTGSIAIALIGGVIAGGTGMTFLVLCF